MRQPQQQGAVAASSNGTCGGGFCPLVITSGGFTATSWPEGWLLEGVVKGATAG